MEKNETSKTAFVYCMLNVSATYQCISGTDPHEQLYAMPNCDRNCGSNLLAHLALTPGKPVPELIL